MDIPNRNGYKEMFKKKQDYQQPANSVVQQREGKINHFLSHYQVPAGLDKNVILNIILTKIEEGNSKRQEVGKIFFFSPVYRIAISTAAFLLVIFLLHFFLSTIRIDSNELLANSYRFPDDSRIVMDFNNHISYPRYWWKREVSLKGNGNAYFEVSKGKRFTVKTNFGDVIVLGTRFELEQFSDKLFIKCFEGSVKFSSKKINHVITEGHAFEFTDNDEEKIVPVVESHPEIAKFNQHFSQVSIKTVAEEISYFFNVKIELVDTTLQKHFSGSIMASDCQSALDSLCKPLTLKYTYNSERKVFVIGE